MANQRDVARVAGVSSATVSRYLSNAESVSSQAADAIREAIATLDYRVDPSAQALRMGKSRHIGVFTPGGGPFHWAIFSAAQAMLHDAGYFSTLYLTWGEKDEPVDPLVPLMRGRQIDGVLYLATLHTADDEALDRLMAWDRPFVVLDRPLLHSSVPQIYVDNYQAGRRAARELLDQGHREFLFLWGRQEFPSAQNRFQGFRDELRKTGIDLPLDRQLEGKFFSLTAYEETARRWAGLPPFTAVFASNDSSALGFLKAARERGADAPRDFSLVGFDDNFEFTLLYDPPLATFSQPADELGYRAARMLLTLLEGGSLESSKVALEAKFIPRASLEPSPPPIAAGNR
jgi:DNA-binding LacI/PurR family transcriptional regulator